MVKLIDFAKQKLELLSFNHQSNQLTCHGVLAPGPFLNLVDKCFDFSF